MANVIVDIATGRVLGFGHADLSSVLRPGQRQLLLQDGEQPPDGVPMRHLRISGGRFVRGNPAQRDAADVADESERRARAEGAVQLQRVVNNPGQLPLPPPRNGLMVMVRDGGAGVPALAVSTNTQWAIFDAQRMIG